MLLANFNLAFEFGRDGVAAAFAAVMTSVSPGPSQKKPVSVRPLALVVDQL